MRLRRFSTGRLTHGPKPVRDGVCMISQSDQPDPPRGGSQAPGEAKGAGRKAKKAKGAGGVEIPEDVEPEFAGFYVRLIEVRDYLIDQLRQHGEMADENAPDPLQQDLAEVGSEEFQRDYNLAMRSGYREQLFEVEEAIRRIKEGTYGICEYSGDPIPRERLEAVPWTRFTMRAQKQLEAEGRGPVRFEIPLAISPNASAGTAQEEAPGESEEEPGEE